MYDFHAAPTEKLPALTLRPEAPFADLKVLGGEAMRDDTGLFRGEYVLAGVTGGRRVEFHLDERTSTISVRQGLRVRELSARELSGLRRAVQAWLDRLGGGDFAASTFLVHLNELVYGRPVLAHFEPLVASEQPGAALSLRGRVGKATLELTLSHAGRLSLTWQPRGCDTARTRRLTAAEAASLVQVLAARVSGEPRTLLDEAVLRVWEAARGALH